MRREQRDGLVAYRFDSLAPSQLDALVSTRVGGISAAPYASLNLGLGVGDEEERVLANRRRFFDAFGLPLQRSVWRRQVHGDRVVVADEDDAGSGSLQPPGVRQAAAGPVGTDPGAAGAHAIAEPGPVEEADAIVTDVPELPLCVTLGDCAAVVLHDPVRGAAGLAHAGWRGTVARIASRTVAAMGERFGSDPADLLAAISPSIGPLDFEVGEEVIAAARAAFGADAERLLEPAGAGKARFDLWAANALDLEAAGVAAARIEVAGISTATSLEDFYSHRVEGGPTGRFIATVSLRRV